MKNKCGFMKINHDYSNNNVIRSLIRRFWSDQQLHRVIILSLACAFVLFLFQPSKTRSDRKGAKTNLLVDLKIKVLTFSRLKSLQRLMASLEKADYGQYAVDLEFHIDAGAPGNVSGFARDFFWTHGNKKVFERVIHGGLIQSVVESWVPQSADEIAVFLEDDIEVSSTFFQWILHVLESLIRTKEQSEIDDFSSFLIYGEETKRMKNQFSINNTKYEHSSSIIGISLYTPRLIETVNPKARVRFDDRIKDQSFMYQIPCSWGAAYFAQPWLEFRDYMRHRMQTGDHVEVYGSTSNGWKESWKKIMIEFMWMNDKYLLYPNFFNQSSFSTNHLEPGQHIVQNDVNHLPIDFTVPLMSEEQYSLVENTNPYAISDRSKKKRKIISLFGESIPTSINSRWFHFSEKTDCKNQNSWGERLCSSTSRETFLFSLKEDKYTVLLSSFNFSRKRILLRIIKEILKSELVDKIIVAWHDQDSCPPDDLYMDARQILFLRSSRDSLNERFMPDVRIRTQAVFILDDDIMVSKLDVDNAFRIWLDNKNRLVGFFPRWTHDSMGMHYAFESENLDGSLGGYRIMLTKAMFVHKKYLYEYMCGIGQSLHDFVDEHMNGEDLAMNYVVSSMVNRGPSALYVRPSTKVGDFGKYLHNGLQKRHEHQSSRSDALRYFSSVMGFYLPQSRTVAFMDQGKQTSTVRYEHTGIVDRHHVDCKATDIFPPCYFSSRFDGE